MALWFANTILPFLLCLFLNLAPTNAEICTKNICEYTFVIHKWRSMTYYNEQDGKTYNVELNGTDLQVVENSHKKKIDDNFIGTVVSADDVITADGYRRDLVAINGQFPGPTIEVMQGAEVVVHVENKLVLEALTVHWHGLHVTGTPWMDGAAYVTQCPILPHNRYTYRFEADPPGTHWYHSHFHTQRMDGLFGLLIIHPNTPTLPTFGVTLTDWVHSDTDALAVQDPASSPPGTGEDQLHPMNYDYTLDNRFLSPLIFKSILINGRGRYNDEPYPLEEFRVAPGQRYRFHLVNTGHSSSFEVSIDDHKLIVVGTESSEFTHFTVDSIMIHAAESYDVEVVASKTNKQTGKFWFRVKTHRLGTGPMPEADDIEQEGRAIMTYIINPAAADGDPTTQRGVCSTASPCEIFNCPFKIYPTGSGKTCKHLDSARIQAAQVVIAKEFGLDTDDDEVVEIFLNFAFPKGASINARSYVQPRVPMAQSNIDDYITPCDNDKCDSEGCSCTHVLEIPANKTIQLVLTAFNLGSENTRPHPIHLHGHNFAVLKMGYSDQDPVTGYGTTDNSDVICSNPNFCSRMQWNGNRPTLNKIKPPLKDNVLVPTRGYTVLRFRSNNPGFWLMHCHIEAHTSQGMVLIVNEGGGHHPKTPEGLPTCGDFELTHDAYQAYRYNKVTDAPDTSARPIEPTPTPPVQRCVPGDDEDTGDRLRENEVRLDFKWAIGVGVGLVILGAALTLLPAIIFTCCKPSKSFNV